MLKDTPLFLFIYYIFEESRSGRLTQDRSENCWGKINAGNAFCENHIKCPLSMLGCWLEKETKTDIVRTDFSGNEMEWSGSVYD